MRTVAEQLGIAIAAGVSEEVLFRGALQPRFGILLSSLLWASFHLQYTCHGFPSVANLYILTLGLIFGALRNRGGLLAAVVAHVTYDASILLQASDGTLVAIAAVGAAAGAVVAQVPLEEGLRRLISWRRERRRQLEAVA